jgi:serine/threonine protein kinase
MAIRIMIVEMSKDYRSLLTHHLTTQWPDARIVEYDPDESGRLSEDFAGADNDLVILGDPLGEESGLAWLRQFKAIKRFPPVVILGDGEERNIVAAIKGGASDYLSRANLSHDLIVGICEAAIETSQVRGGSSPSLTNALDIPGIKGFEVERRISGGEIASVYLTKEQATGRETVLKVLRQVPDVGDDNQHFDRFLREFELIGNIDHPNIVKIFDLGIADEHAFIAMEYCSRGSLKRRIRLGMYADKAEETMRDIAQALGAIHDVGILHRDLKPTNVLFREDESLALIDFGLAKQAHLNAELTGTGEIFGTPYYMSPEQGHGESLDVRSDIYSLGIIFYEMLTGSKPYEGGNAMAVILKHARDPIPRLPSHLAQYQPAIDKMMAKKAIHRFQTVKEVLEWRPATV